MSARDLSALKARLMRLGGGHRMKRAFSAPAPVVHGPAVTTAGWYESPLWCSAAIHEGVIEGFYRAAILAA